MSFLGVFERATFIPVYITLIVCKPGITVKPDLVNSSFSLIARLAWYELFINVTLYKRSYKAALLRVVRASLKSFSLFPHCPHHSPYSYLLTDIRAIVNKGEFFSLKRGPYERINNWCSAVHWTALGFAQRANYWPFIRPSLLSYPRRIIFKSIRRDIT